MDEVNHKLNVHLYNVSLQKKINGSRENYIFSIALKNKGLADELQVILNHRVALLKKKIIRIKCIFVLNNYYHLLVIALDSLLI